MDLANALREERKSAELQPLDEDFYQQVGTYLTGMSQ
jgi:DNA replication initiation complex subunit (GINS family)